MGCVLGRWAKAAPRGAGDEGAEGAAYRPGDGASSCSDPDVTEAAACGRLLELLLSALCVLRDYPALHPGPRVCGAVDDLVRLTCAPLLQCYDELVEQQAQQIAALERRCTMTARLGERVPPTLGASRAAARSEPPRLGVLLSCHRRLCPACGQGRDCRSVASQADLGMAVEITPQSPCASAPNLRRNRSALIGSPLPAGPDSEVDRAANAAAQREVLDGLRANSAAGASMRVLQPIRIQCSPQLSGIQPAESMGIIPVGSLSSLCSDGASPERSGRQRDGPFKALLALAARLSTAVPTDDVSTLCEVGVELRQLLTADAALLFMADGEGLSPDATLLDRNGRRPASEHSSAGHDGLPFTLAQRAARGGLVIPCRDCPVDPDYDFAKDAGLRSAVAVAVSIEDTLAAVVVITNAGCEFSSDDLELCSRAAQVGQIALRSARLFRAAVFQRKKTTVMMETLRALATADLDGDLLPSAIMRTARGIAQADRCALFVVDSEREEFSAHLQSRGGKHEVLVMPMDRDVAGHVVRTGQPINLVDAYEDPRFNPEIDELTDYRTQSLLCLPVMYENRIVAVAQLANKVGAEGFGSDDIELLESFAVFAGVSLRSASLYQQLARQRRTTEMILSIVQTLSESDIRDIDSVTDKVMQGAKKLSNADRCALFMVDEEHNQLYAKVRPMPSEPAAERDWRLRHDSLCSAAGSSHSSCSGGPPPTAPATQEIRIAIGTGIAGAVAESGEVCNIPEAYSDPRFNSEVDKRTGYRTRAILAYPIKHKGRVVAVAQLINKLDAHGRDDDVFSAEDEMLLQVFASFAGITIGNARLYRFVLEAGNRAMDLFNMQYTSGPASGREKSKVRIATVEAAAEYSNVQCTEEERRLAETVTFPVHSYAADQPAHVRLVPLAVSLLHKSGVVEKFGIDEAMLYRFTATVKGAYRAVPYHNFAHAFDVMQTLYIFLQQCGARELLTDLDALCLLLIGLFHDADHMGLNNSYHLKAETPLGLLSSASGSKSVLEVHHCSIAIEILCDPDTNILCGLSEDDRKYAFKVIIHAILATDMSRHGEIVADFEKALEVPYDRGCDEHRLRLMAMLVKAADVSNVAKPFRISRGWGRRVQQEFDWQGEQEQMKKLATEAVVDVRHSLVAFGRGQMGFMGAVVRPMWRVLCKQVPELGPFAVQLERNYARWKRAVEECLIAYSTGCSTPKGVYYRYYYKLAAHAAWCQARKGRELDVVAHIDELPDEAE